MKEEVIKMIIPTIKDKIRKKFQEMRTIMTIMKKIKTRATAAAVEEDTVVKRKTLIIHNNLKNQKMIKIYCLGNKIKIKLINIKKIHLLNNFKINNFNRETSLADKFQNRPHF
jgi:hypothetical protein